MERYEVIYDISVTLGRQAIDWPGNPPYQRKLVKRMKDGDLCDTSQLIMTTHVGTHVDTPAHYITGRENLDAYPIEEWILTAHVVNVEDKEVVRPSELMNLDIQTGDALLFKTDNSMSGRCIKGIFTESFVYISLEVADLCIEKKVSLVGIDYNSVDKYGDFNYPVHYKLLGNGVRILESINLRDVLPGKYTLFCFPLKIEGAEGAPARAIIMR